jgi:hypothetical protein
MDEDRRASCGSGAPWFELKHTNKQCTGAAVLADGDSMAETSYTEALGPNGGGGYGYIPMMGGSGGGIADSPEYVAVEWAAEAWGASGIYSDRLLETPVAHASSLPSPHSGIHLEDCIEGAPTHAPSDSPSLAPSYSYAPSAAPSLAPSVGPTQAAAPPARE